MCVGVFISGSGRGKRTKLTNGFSRPLIKVEISDINTTLAERVALVSRVRI
jgi:hypothetical protein